MALILKSEIKNNPVSIFLGRKSGGKVKFDPIKVDQKDYKKYKLIGFNIFRCDSCGTDSCFGDCSINSVKEVEVVAPLSEKNKKEKHAEKTAIEIAIEEVENYTQKLCDCGNELSDKRKKKCDNCKKIKND